MGGRPCRLLLTLAVIAANNLDRGAPASSHLHRLDVIMTSRTACQRQLSDDIDACLSAYERVRVSLRVRDTELDQLQRSVVRILCRLVRLLTCHAVKDDVLC